MIKKLAILLIAIVAIGAVVTVYAFYSGEEYWETETVFGKWQEKIVVEYEDGTTDSLKILEDHEALPLSVKYDGKNVKTLTYQIYAVATGEGYDSFDIDWFYTTTTIEDSSGSIIYGPAKSSTGTKTGLSLDNSHQLVSIGIGIKATIDDEPEGAYTVIFGTERDIQYKGNPGGSWQTAENPPGREITVQVTNDNFITLVLSSGTQIGYE